MAVTRGFFWNFFYYYFEPILIDVIRMKCKALKHVIQNVHWLSFWLRSTLFAYSYLFLSVHGNRAYYLCLYKYLCLSMLRLLASNRKSPVLPPVAVRKALLGSHCICVSWSVHGWYTLLFASVASAKTNSNFPEVSKKYLLSHFFLFGIIEFLNLIF